MSCKLKLIWIIWNASSRKNRWPRRFSKAKNLGSHLLYNITNSVFIAWFIKGLTCKKHFLPDENSINLISVLNTQGVIFSLKNELDFTKTKVLLNLALKLEDGTKFVVFKKVGSNFLKK